MKKILHFVLAKLWIIIPILIIFMWSILGILGVFSSDQGLTILSHPVNAAVISQNSKEINLEVKPLENNLGIISLSLKSNGIKKSGTTTFQIKESGANKWYYQKKYSNQLVSSVNPFPFGFLPIAASKDKIYSIKITSSSGSYLINGAFLKYQFAKESLTSDMEQLIKFVAKKAWYASWYLEFVPVLIFAAVSSVIILGVIRSNKRNVKFFKRQKKFSINLKIVIVIALGLLVRLFLATGSYNFDVVQWIQIGPVAREHLNIYSYNQYYNYSPIWFFVLGGLDRLAQIFISVPYPFIVRAFLSLVDVVTFFVIIKIAKGRGLPALKTASLFFLNPVSVIISGHHGQFDNVAILLFLLGIYYSEKSGVVSKMKKRLVFAFLTASLLLKHVVVFQVLYFFTNFAKSKIKGILLFSVSCLIFLSILIPFISSSSGQIINRVFLYGGVSGLYGFSYFIGNLCTNCFVGPVTIQIIYKLVFLLGYFGFVLFVKQKDLVRGALLTILFFLVFTSGIGAQYFLLPIAFGVFFPTRWFYLYVIATTLFFLGSADELNIYTFKVFEWNTVWLFAILWFLAEFAIVFKPLQKLRKAL